MTSLPEGWQNTRQNMIMLQHCILKRVLQQFYSGNQETTKSLLSGFPAALQHGYRAAGHRSKSTGLPGESERTLIAIKPDGVQRRLVGQIIQRFEQRGFKLVGMKMMKVSEDLLSQHYCELRTKPFYPSLLHYMTSGPVVVMVWEGHEVVQTSRKMVGHTNPAEAQAGTVRGDFSIHVSRNVVHASDSLEGAQREIQLWFQGKELLNWDCCDQTSTCEV
ncbi:nucleoside diphosphate kinase, mitochondrial isoform X1 [Micropterus dolomieu]|uniref:nucleoside diphosphate kinase, mitochondrial isoform X1 n=2 Tax=Micropterus dolomieu TaxID=147949 RepID=UPI001E8E39DB|nr:nucleoside diphosphate kinase, mitochondrial isoform X1 [Micropterus dolomieu]